MHVLFAHQNFPAQFGHIAKHLVEQRGYQCSFVSEKAEGDVAGIRCVKYQSEGGATRSTHFCSRTFENQIWHSHGMFKALESVAELRPDLVVGHSGFTSTLFLRELFDCPILNYFEYFYRTHNSDMDFRHDLPPCSAMARLRSRARNAMLLLDLHNCDGGYAPTRWQHSTLPAEYQNKIDVIFDGIDTSIWRPVEVKTRIIGGHTIPADVKVVTYVSRGMESMRGFDIFMQVAKRVCEERSDVIFLVVGEDRVAYGGDLNFTEGKSFKEWVLARGNYDLERIRFLGRVSPDDLVQLFSLSDLHIYLTVPFVLSWSLMNALACGTTVLASSTAPVCEMIKHEENGLLADFFDVEGMAQQVRRVLDDPQGFTPLGEKGRAMIETDYELEGCLERMVNLYERCLRSPT